MRLLIPVSIAIRWQAPRVWWTEFVYRRRRAAWDNHAWADPTTCSRCRWYAENHENKTTPCADGRKLLDRLYPLSKEERDAWYVKVEAALAAQQLFGKDDRSG